MTELKKKIKLALDEARMLVLGAQILLGFEYRSVLEPRFDDLSHVSQLLIIVALGCTLLTTALLMWPAAHHQMVEDGDVTGPLHRFTTRSLCWGLLPFAAALGLELYCICQSLIPVPVAAAVGIGATLLALFCWYGLESIAVSKGDGSRERKMTEKQQKEPAKPTELFDKIDHVLTECRVVIPGAQALLGFQFIAMLSNGFHALPRSSQLVHLGALLLIGLSMILLMTPAAYHRIVVSGESTKEFWRHARRMLLSAMAILALGLGAEFYVVSAKVLESQPAAIGISVTAVVVFYGMWFGYPLALRWLGGKSNVTDAIGHPA